MSAQLLANPLLYFTASTVAKQAFAAFASSSLRNISASLNERFSGDAEVAALRDELELKVNVVSLPIDVCVQQAVRGNTVLQKAVDVALAVLRDIEDFSETLRGRELSVARGESPAAGGELATPAAAARKLRHLINQLDTICPYLNLAITAVSLIDGQQQKTISPSRLLIASAALQSAPQAPGASVYSIAKARWHGEAVGTVSRTGDRPMQALYLRCSVQLRRAAAPSAASNGHETKDQPAHSFQYELHIRQDLEDGTYHDTEEEAQQEIIAVQDIAGIEWSTTQSLSLGDNDFSPALVISVDREPMRRPSSAAPALSPGTPASAARRPSAAAGRANVSRFAIQCNLEPGDDEEDGSVTTAGSGQEPIVAGSAEWGTLGELEYAIRLALAECREETSHMLLADERLQMAFNVVPSRQLQPATKRDLADASALSLDTVAKNFSKLGFGSPVL